MPKPLPLPIRVLVKGASTVIAMSEVGAPREEFTFPRAIEATLLQAGHPVDVHTFGVASERTKTTLRTWESEIMAWSPDVVILVYGHYESIHFILPWWLERHANSLRRRPGKVRETYRARLLRPIWMALAKLQAKLDLRLNSLMFASRPKRVAADLERLITHASGVSSPLIILLELLPPTGKGRSWFPGMTERIDMMNQTIAAMVARLDNPNVRIFPVSDAVTRHVPEGENPTPDGFHYTATLHREVGKELAAEILSWVEKQPHLQL
ncbi:MAG: hypothetical protein ABI232_06920 [Jatrophihabitantaceae bacterium]